MNASSFDVVDVPRCQDEVVDLRRGCQQCVNSRERIRNVEPSPLFRNPLIDRQDMLAVLIHNLLQPAFQSCRCDEVVSTNQFDAFSDFADHQYAQINLVIFNRVEPMRHVRMATVPLAKLRNDSRVQ